MGRYGLETIHPDYELILNDEFKPQILPKYRLTKGISQQKMRNLIQAAIELVKNKGIEIQDYLPKNSLKPLNEAIINLHQPNPHSNINEYLIGGASGFEEE